MRFENKVAIVTGSGQGIGEHYAKALAAEGAAVVVAELNPETGVAVADAIVAEGGRAVFVKADVASENSAAEVAATAVETFGGIDLLINNAAIYAGMKRAAWMDVELEYYRRFMSVNMDGVLIMTRAVHAAMVERGGGVILNQSSTAGYGAGGYYGLAKLGVNGLTIALAKELGPKGIRVNGIAPGPTDTMATQTSVPPAVIQMLLAQMPLARMGSTQDIVNTALFLLSEDASWVTGQTWCVDGGQTLRI
jgi:NAD(P)-dependent dehydrogenase (short-subunit alcohol dehydrogenase family)